MRSEGRRGGAETAVASISTSGEPLLLFFALFSDWEGLTGPAGPRKRGSQTASFLHGCWGIQAQLLMLAQQALSRLNHRLSPH